MTQGVDMRDVLIKSLVLAVCATLIAAPYFYYLITKVSRDGRHTIEIYSRAFLFSQLFVLFILCLLSALAGFSFSKRYGLPGFGDVRRLIHDAPFLFFLGFLTAALSYFIFDRFFFEISHSSYPKGIFYISAFVLKGAVTDETILRLCFVTVGIGIFKNKQSGVVLSSIIATLFTFKYRQYIGMSFDIDALFIAQTLFSFAVNLFLGYLFVTRGFFYVMTFKWFFGIKYVMVCMMMDKSGEIVKTILTNPVFLR